MVSTPQWKVHRSKCFFSFWAEREKNNGSARNSEQLTDLISEKWVWVTKEIRRRRSHGSISLCLMAKTPQKAFLVISRNCTNYTLNSCCVVERERKRKEKQKKFKELCVGHRSETNSQVGSRTATENRLCFGTRTESRESWGKKTNCTHCVASQRQTVSLGSKLPSIVPTFPNSFSTLYYAINCTFLRYVNKYSMLFISTLLYLLNSTWLHELFVPV